MTRPEGYRKALRLMKTAEKFGLPVFTFVDTPGAFPGIEAEERGQSEAIGRNIYEMAQLQTPIITTVIGEGGSGGALAIAVADQVLMLQYAVYSVISPEGCASILWKTGEKAQDAADAMGITAHRLAPWAWWTRSSTSPWAAPTATPSKWPPSSSVRWAMPTASWPTSSPRNCRTAATSACKATAVSPTPRQTIAEGRRHALAH